MMNWNDHIIYAMKIRPEDTGYCFYFSGITTYERDDAFLKILRDAGQKNYYQTKVYCLALGRDVPKVYLQDMKYWLLCNRSFIEMANPVDLTKITKGMPGLVIAEKGSSWYNTSDTPVLERPVSEYQEFTKVSNQVTFDVVKNVISDSIENMYGHEINELITNRTKLINRLRHSYIGE